HRHLQEHLSRVARIQVDSGPPHHAADVRAVHLYRRPARVDLHMHGYERTTGAPLPPLRLLRGVRAARPPARLRDAARACWASRCRSCARWAATWVGVTEPCRSAAVAVRFISGRGPNARRQRGWLMGNASASSRVTIFPSARSMSSWLVQPQSGPSNTSQNTVVGSAFKVPLL